MLTRRDVSQHASRKSCWIIVNKQVLDVTEFLDSHPGGRGIILKYAGKDATEAFEPLHSKDTIDKYLSPKQKLGSLVQGEDSRDTQRSRLTQKGQDLGITKAVGSIANQKVEPKMLLRSVLNLEDFEIAASHLLKPSAFAFFKAGAESETSAKWNKKSWKAIRFRPRVLKPAGSVDLATTIMGTQHSAPFFISPAGGGKLAHRSGETLMTEAAAKHDVLQWVCTNAGCTQKQMADARAPNQVLYWQIYAMADLEKTERDIRSAIALGYQGFALTVDAVRLGKRERDLRMALSEMDDGADDGEDDETAGLIGGISTSRPTMHVDFDWESAVSWIRSITDLPIAMKGIQCWEDAALCMRHHVHPWLSNHGGRQLDSAPSAAETLVEMRQHCPEVFTRCDVIVDGGITRGADVVKALALGAKAVGVGRGFLYALAFGQAGVGRAIHILKQEIETTMALIGVRSISELNPSHVDVTGLSAAGGIYRAAL